MRLSVTLTIFQSHSSVRCNWTFYVIKLKLRVIFNFATISDTTLLKDKSKVRGDF